MHRRVADDPVTRPGRADAFARLFMQLLELDPDTRPDAAGAPRFLDDFARRVRDPTHLPSPRSGSHAPSSPAPESAPAAGSGPSTRPGGRRRLPAAAAALTVLVLGAGLLVLTRDDPTAIPDIPEFVQPLAVTGDYAAANPCALLDTAVMSRFGPASIGPGSDVGECRLTNAVREAGLPPTVTEAHYGNSYSENDSSVSEQDLGGVRIHRSGSTSMGCSSLIVFRDRNFLRITTKLFDGGVGPNSCEINEAAVAVATSRLADNGVTYSPEWQSTITLARYNACDLAADAPGFVPGISDKRAGSPNGSACFMGDTTQGAPYVHISLGLVPEGGMSRFGRAAVVDGKTTYTRPASPYNVNGPACTVDLVHRSGSDGGASHPTEYLGVQIEGATPYGARCQQALSIALAMERNTT